RVRTSFEIYLHIKDVDILYKIQSFFGVGNVYLRAYKNIAVYRVSNIEYLRDIIIPHFNNYPLITQKSIDFNLWCKVIQIILNKEHLNNKGFLTILTYYASINRGISKKVLKYYPNIKPVSRSSINLPNNLNPFWVSGF
ncbi:homing endonuclease, partial [Phlegmacium glaucopus]